MVNTRERVRKFHVDIEDEREEGETVIIMTIIIMTTTYLLLWYTGRPPHRTLHA